MLKEDCERIGVLECGAAFQKIGFMFREQPIGDYGIDAIIETNSVIFPLGIVQRVLHKQ